MRVLYEGRRLHKYFSDKRDACVIRACDQVYITVGEGATVGLVGESGCGKTTVGRVLLRLIDADKGIIYYRGRNLTRLHEKDSTIVFFGALSLILNLKDPTEA